MPVEVDPYSMAVIPVRQFFNDTYLGHATAFVWASDVGLFLKTNRHVVTMINHERGHNLHRKAARPNKLEVWFNLTEMRIGKIDITLPLLDENAEPLWLVHPEHQNKIDLAAIPLPPNLQNVEYFPINNFPATALAKKVGVDVFVLGYPFEPKIPSYPIWKRGSIASEPDLVGSVVADADHFLVDTASRPGMSGAPVILRSWGTFNIGGRFNGDNAGVRLAPTGRLFGKATHSQPVGHSAWESLANRTGAGNRSGGHSRCTPLRCEKLKSP